MALNPLKSHITAEKAAWAPYFAVGGFNASTIETGSLVASTVQASSITAYSVSSVLLDAEEINTSTISTIALDLDGQYLTATASNLLLNGIPIATTANLSSLADWSFFPAISSVNMNGNNLINTANISTGSIIGGTGFFTQLMAINSMFLSTYTSTISSLEEYADAGYFSTISTGNATGGDFAPSSLWGLPSSFYHDAISSISSLNAENIVCSTLTAANYISTPALLVSSINGSEFNSTGIVVQVAGVSSLVANSISSIGAELRTALVSTLQFNPSFSPNLDVNLGLGSLFGNLAGAALGGIGVLVGGAALGTGIAALTQSRQTNNIGSPSSFELVNGTTQLQVSTVGQTVSSIFRFVSSIDEFTPGQEFFASTIIPAGTVCIRSVSDPLNTVSSPNSTIQYFGQWVNLEEVLPPAVTVSSFTDLHASSLETSSITFGGTPALTLKSAVTAQLDVLDGAGNFGQLGAVEFWSRGSLTDPNFGVFSRSSGNRAQYTDSNLTPHLLLYTNDSNAAISSLSTAEMLTVSSINGQPISFYQPGGESTISTFQDLYTSSLGASTITVQDRVVILPSTVYSGIWMPFDVNQVPGIYMGLSTGLLTNNYAAFGAGEQFPYNESNTRGLLLYQTEDAEVSYQYGDMTIGRLMVAGNTTNYGANPSAYMTGDATANMTLHANTVQLSTANVFAAGSLQAPNLLTSSLTASTISLPSTGLIQGSIGVGTGTVLSSFQSIDTLNLATGTLNASGVGQIFVNANLSGNDGVVAQFSTLIADELTSTQQLEVSSLNGYAWSNITSLNQGANYIVTTGNQSLWLGNTANQGASTFLSTGTYYSLQELSANFQKVAQGLGGVFSAFSTSVIGNKISIGATAGATEFGISWAVIPPTPPPYWNPNPFSGAAIQSNADLLGGIYGNVYGGAGGGGDAGLLPNPAQITAPIFGSEMTFSTIQAADFVRAQNGSVSSLTASSINGGVALLDSQSGTLSSLVVSSLVADFGLISSIFTGGIAGVGLSTQITNFSSIQANGALFSTVTANSLSASSLTLTAPNNVSTGTILMTSAAGTQQQPAQRFRVGADIDLGGANDLWARNLRVGAGNTGTGAEVIFYDPSNQQSFLNWNSQDRALRNSIQAKGLTNYGYLLDTFVNPPFFSTINAGTSTAMMSWFPSTLVSTIGYSTLSVIPNPIFVAAANSLSSQKVLAANTPLALDLGTASVNIGGYTLAASTLTVPVAGTYQLTPSIQFQTTSGGANQVDFWLTKNGVDIPNSGSRVSLANNAEDLGTVIVYDTAAAGDKYGIKIASPDANMTAGFFQSTVTTPYTRPAIPAVILNAQRVA